MKREIERKIKSLCDEIGTSAAAACEKVTSDLETEYDRLVENGMAELDAYRNVLKDLDKIKETLASLEKTPAEKATAEKRSKIKDLKKITSKISTCMWLLTVILYFLVSFIYGHWHITWLIFLWGSMGEIVLDMVVNYNKGKPLRKVLKSGLSGIMWLLTVILFFLISFATGRWGITWIIFICGTLLQTVIGWIFNE